jgi:hypothetical protein
MRPVRAVVASASESESQYSSRLDQGFLVGARGAGWAVLPATAANGGHVVDHARMLSLADSVQRNPDSWLAHPAACS